MADLFYDNYDRLIRLACAGYELCLELVAKNIPKSVTSVLDLGSGTGNLIQAIINRRSDIKICGMELQQDLINMASAKRGSLGNVSIIQGDILKGDWPPAECVTSSLTIHHFTDKEKEQLFRRIYASADYFLYFDRFKGRSKAEEKHNLNYVFSYMRENGLSEDLVQKARDDMAKNDRPITIENFEAMLMSIGFGYRRLHFDHGFAVYFCSKKE
jgi:SAM-dependent methyltransferase